MCKNYTFKIIQTIFMLWKLYMLLQNVIRMPK
jgi:hypothetical protein